MSEDQSITYKGMPWRPKSAEAPPKLTMEKILKARAVFEEAESKNTKYHLKFGMMIANSEQIKEYFDLDLDKGLYYVYDDGRIERLRD